MTFQPPGIKFLFSYILWTQFIVFKLKLTYFYKIESIQKSYSVMLSYTLEPQREGGGVGLGSGQLENFK